jgi:hypothetical protein
MLFLTRWFGVSGTDDEAKPRCRAGLSERFSLRPSSFGLMTRQSTGELANHLPMFLALNLANITRDIE